VKQLSAISYQLLAKGAGKVEAIASCRLEQGQAEG
jgi:hypothetical protein